MSARFLSLALCLCLSACATTRPNDERGRSQLALERGLSKVLGEWRLKGVSQGDLVGSLSVLLDAQGTPRAQLRPQGAGAPPVALQVGLTSSELYAWSVDPPRVLRLTLPTLAEAPSTSSRLRGSLRLADQVVQVAARRTQVRCVRCPGGHRSGGKGGNRVEVPESGATTGLRDEVVLALAPHQGHSLAVTDYDLRAAPVSAGSYLLWAVLGYPTAWLCPRDYEVTCQYVLDGANPQSLRFSLSLDYFERNPGVGDLAFLVATGVFYPSPVLSSDAEAVSRIAHQALAKELARALDLAATRPLPRIGLRKGAPSDGELLGSN